MYVNTSSSAAAARNYEPANSANAGKTGKTGKHETPMHQSYAPHKGKGGEAPEYNLDISEAAMDSEKLKGKGKKGIWKDFDMDAFQSEIRNSLMKSINEAKESLLNSGIEFAKYSSDSILYDLSGMKDVQAAKVPDYWNAENTSQRIFDFAMSFRELAPELSDEEYIEQIRSAVEKGFGQAKKAIGDLPGPSAKLYNDTYGLTMKKFDDYLEQMQAKKAEEADSSAASAAEGK